MKKILLICCIIFLSSCKTTECFAGVVRDMGYNDVLSEPEEIVSVSIPENFNDVYIKYNKLQKEGGFDLTPYKGKECTRYTYLIPSVNARANILVYDGKIIGGDICGITLDGIMIPLRKTDEKS